MASVLTTLENGSIIDLDGVAVIRSVSQRERDNANLRRRERSPQAEDRNFTVAIETRGAEGRVNTVYDSDLTVAEFVANKTGPLASKFKLINGTAAVNEDARVLAIQPLAKREGSDNASVLYLEGGSSRGLFTTLPVAELVATLGTKATAHLSAIGKEALIDRKAITRKPTLFDADAPLAEGQKRYTCAVTIGKSQLYFMATPAEVLGQSVIDGRAAQRPTEAPAQAKPAAARKTHG